MTRAYVTLSCAVSLDGYLDRSAPGGLAMSNAADFDRVDQLRADSDAIMVGASTVRRDDPRLLVHSTERRAQRKAVGRTPSPLKVTVTATGDLSADAAFFTASGAERLVYCPRSLDPSIQARLARMATVVPLAPHLAMADVVDDLTQRGVRRLLVEGGGRLLTQFLTEEVADELQLVIAPLFVGEPDAPRFVGPGRFPWTPSRRARLAETRAIGDVVLLRYALTDRCGA